MTSPARKVSMLQACRLTALLAITGIVGTCFATDLIDPSLRAFEQKQVQTALDHLAPQRPGTPDLYVVGFGGDNTEDVFRNEAVYLETLMAERFDARNRIVTLINHADSLIRTPRPLATLENLRATLKGIAGKMDRDEDVLFLFMTMHGTPDHFLYVKMAPAYVDLIDPKELRTALDDAGIRNRVLVISACYAGGFLPALQNEDTLVITAAHRNRSSFGCGPDSNATYFGRAYLSEALNETTDFVAAFETAKIRIAEREKAEKFKPSRPQIAIGKHILARLQAWQAQLVSGQRVPYAFPDPEPAAATQAAEKRPGSQP